MTILDAVAQRLIELMREKNLTMNSLAQVSAIPPSTVKNSTTPLRADYHSHNCPDSTNFKNQLSSDFLPNFSSKFKSCRF